MADLIKLSDLELSLEKIIREIEKLEKFEEAKEYHDKAETLFQYYKKQHRERHDVKNRLAILKIEAAVRGGEILKRMKDEGEREPGQKGRPDLTLDDKTLKTLSDLGVTKFLSHRWQTMAKLSKEERQKFYKKVKEKKAGYEENEWGELGESNFYNYVRKHFKKPNVWVPPKGEYEVIVIDPPWPYKTSYNPDSRRVGSPYPELSIEELEKGKLPAAKNCILWCWTTHKFLHDAIHLVDNWGFDYKLTFVWDKEKLGIGAWLRCQVEFCILAIKGKPKWNLTNERDILRVKRTKHSAKPIEFYEMVEKLCPSVGDRADIFPSEITNNREGWDHVEWKTS